MVSDKYLDYLFPYGQNYTFAISTGKAVKKYPPSFLPEAAVIIVRTLFMNNVKKTSVLALSVNSLKVTALLP